MEHWSERLQLWMDAEGLRVPELSRRSGVPKESIYKYLRGRTDAPRGEIIPRLAKAFGKSAPELLYGRAAVTLTQVKERPLLRTSDLRQLSPLKEALTTWQGPMISVPDAAVSEYAFALSIEDSACSPHLQRGDVIIVDPTTPTNPGDYVVVFVVALAVGVVRRYRPVDAFNPMCFVLIADNPDYPQIAINDANPGELIGRAVGLFKPL